MKTILILIISSALMGACNGDAGGRNDQKKTPSNKTMTTIPSDAPGDLTMDREAFISACMKDAAAWAPDEPRRSRFCACAWQRSQGRYDSATFANGAGLAKNPRYSFCYEQAGN